MAGKKMRPENRLRDGSGPRGAKGSCKKIGLENPTAGGEFCDRYDDREKNAGTDCGVGNPWGLMDGAFVFCVVLV